MSELDISKPVMFAAASGSFGRIIETVPPNGWHYSPRYTVRWCYGVDAKGEPMYATSRGKGPMELVNIDENLYAEYIKLPGFSDSDRRQRDVRKKIIAKVREWNRWI